METYQPEPQIQQSPSPQPKKGGRCCLWSCLSIVGIFALMGVCLLVGPFLLQAVGLIGLPAEERYAAAPDQFASEQLQTTLSEFSIEGAQVYVIPEHGTNKQTAFIILDSSEGFNGFSDLATDSTQSDVNNRMDEVLALLVDKNNQYNLRISRVALDYRDENGESFMTMTTTIKEVEDYLAGLLTFEEFYGEFGMDIRNILNQLWEEYNE